jgi:hypothetical protein
MGIGRACMTTGCGHRGFAGGACTVTNDDCDGDLGAGCCKGAFVSMDKVG